MRYADRIALASPSELEPLSPHVERMVRLKATRRSNRYVHTTFAGSSRDEEFLLVDPAFFEVFDFPLLRGGAATVLSERNSVVLSYKMAQRLFGYDDPLGQRLTISSMKGSGVEDFTITGVAAPIPRTSSIQFNYEPEVSFERALVRLNTREVDDALAGLEQLWEKVAPEQPFEYEFLDRAFARQYEKDKESSRTVTFASVVAILIACMGLFGHATIVLQRRTKEIGVRKVLGATVAEILALLSRDLTKMVALACLLAFPLAHFLVGQWLSRYAYQFGLGLTTYLLCGTIAFAIALGTVAYIGVRAARENPVHALRYE